MNQKRALIAGCGYVGSRLAEMLIEDGYNVSALKRTSTGLPDGAEFIQGDLSRRDLSLHLSGQYDYVCFALSAGGFNEPAYQQAYVQCQSYLLSELKKFTTCDTRYLFVSSTSVYHQNAGEIVDELSDVHPTNFSGSVMLEAEKVAENSGMRCTVIRFGGIYGPGRTRLIDLVRSKLATLRPDPPYSNRIHRDDAAAAVRHIFQLKNPESIYVGVDSEPVNTNEVFQWLGQQLGFEILESEVAGPGSPLRGNKRCSNHRLIKSGFRFIFPSYQDGYGSMLSDV